MATVSHASLTGADLHEPKGIASANSGEVYVANGAGGGVWTNIKNLNTVEVHYKMEGINTMASHWIVPGVAGNITKIHSVIDQAIATADTVLTFEIGGVLITGSTITITQAGSAAGDVDSSTPSAANTITADTAVEMITDGGTTTAATATITFTIDVS